MTTTTFGWKRFGAARAATLWAGVACALTLEGTALALPDGMTDSELMSTLKTGRTGAREEACDRLGDRRATSARAEIAKAAEADESARVRQSCVEALGELGGAESAAVLRRIAMADKNDEVREEALEALEDVGTEADDAEAVARVLESDRSTRVRKEAAEFLTQASEDFGPPELPKEKRRIMFTCAEDAARRVAPPRPDQPGILIIPIGPMTNWMSLRAALQFVCEQTGCVYEAGDGTVRISLPTP